MVIKCIFYSEFDNIAGPRIVWQYPQGYVHLSLSLFPPSFSPLSSFSSFILVFFLNLKFPLRCISNETFDSVSEYIIPKASLCGHLISLYVLFYFSVTAYPLKRAYFYVDKKIVLSSQ